MITEAQALEMSKLDADELTARLDNLMCDEKAREAMEIHNRGTDAVLEYLVSRMSEEDLIKIFLVWATMAAYE